jgi:dihydroneopterin aldolase
MSAAPLPTALRRLSVERLRVMASVGILDHELTARQALLVSVHVEQRGAALIPAADDVHHVLDYRHLRDAVLDEAAAGHVNMLETLAGRIAQRLLARRSVRRVQVRITKPNIFPDCDGASVELDVHAATPD